MAAIHEASMEVRDDARALRAQARRIRAASEALRARCLEDRRHADGASPSARDQLPGAMPQPPRVAPVLRSASRVPAREHVPAEPLPAGP
jgi:hypothetical protein